MKLTHRIFALLLTVLLLLSCVVPTVLAAEPADPQTEEASPRAEVTEWQYRIYNGKMQKRLWSVTNQVWLTDWMDV